MGISWGPQAVFLNAFGNHTRISQKFSGISMWDGEIAWTPVPWHLFFFFLVVETRMCRGPRKWNAFFFFLTEAYVFESANRFSSCSFLSLLWPIPETKCFAVQSMAASVWHNSVIGRNIPLPLWIIPAQDCTIFFFPVSCPFLASDVADCCLQKLLPLCTSQSPRCHPALPSSCNWCGALFHGNWRWT